MNIFKNKNIKIAIGTIASILSLILPLSVSCSNHKNNVDLDKTLNVIKNVVPKTLEELQNTNISYLASLPKYDSRNYGIVTPVKDQKTSDLCWAYAAASTAETNILRKSLLPNYTSDNFLIDEYNIAYLAKQRTSDADKLGLTSKDIINLEINQGSNSFVATSTLTQWNSPNIKTNNNKPTYDSIALLEDTFYLDKVHYLDKSFHQQIASVKEAIANYGAVNFSFVIKDSIYKSNYYNTEDNGNFISGHIATIVGWDDSISKNLYTKPASLDGGWIVKNSWGSNANHNGYFYLSYDSFITEIWGYEFANLDKYENNYYYDGINQPVGGYTSTNYGSKFGVIFPTLKSTEQNKEKLKAINVGIKTENTTIKVDIYVNVNANLNNPNDLNNNPENGKLITSIEKTFKYSGYHTIELPKTIDLEPNSNFSIVITVSNYDNNAEILLSDESESNNDMTFFVNKNGWQNTKLQHNGYENLVARIKAFTTTKDNNQEFVKSSHTPLIIGISVGGGGVLIIASTIAIIITIKRKNSKSKKN